MKPLEEKMEFLARIGQEATEKARQELWALDLPYVYAKDGKIWAAYPDGRIEDITPTAADVRLARKKEK